MLTQTVLNEVVSSSPSLHFRSTAPDTAGFLRYKIATYESIWDLSRRICDRYLPEPTEG
jgi:hypothetical protein